MPNLVDKSAKYYAEARNRAQRRKSPWNLILIPLCGGSVVAVGRIDGLRYLDRVNLKVRDESLEALGSLVGLKELNLANFYPLREFARLSARLKHTQCAWFRPTVDLPNVQCPQCDKTSLVLLTGKGSRTMCRECDADQIRRHEDLFQELAC